MFSKVDDRRNAALKQDSVNEQSDWLQWMPVRVTIPDQG